MCLKWKASSSPSAGVPRPRQTRDRRPGPRARAERVPASPTPPRACARGPHAKDTFLFDGLPSTRRRRFPGRVGQHSLSPHHTAGAARQHREPPSRAADTVTGSPFGSPNK